MNYRGMFFALAAVGAAFAARAEEETAERDTFGKWRIAVGGSFNAPVRSSLGMRNLTMPARYVVPIGQSRDAAWSRARNHEYEGGGYVAADELDNGWNTENWKLPVSAYDRDSKRFSLSSGSYREVIGSSASQMSCNDSPDPCQYGLSFEVSRELWIHDEAFEHRWGVDFAAAFSYFFQRDVYRANAVVTRTDTVREGVVRTDINDPDAMYDYDNGYDSPVNGMYGHGTYYNDYVSPALLWENIGSPYDVGGTRSVSASRQYSARGDYQELEMLFMLRPWYEITDWWRVYGQVGVGVSWGLFESEVTGSGLGCCEDFSKWDCYGVAGVGTMFRYKMFDISFDFLGRFLRDDMDIDGKYLNGSIRRSDWGFRLMVGVEF